MQHAWEKCQKYQYYSLWFDQVSSPQSTERDPYKTKVVLMHTQVELIIKHGLLLTPLTWVHTLIPIPGVNVCQHLPTHVSSQLTNLVWFCDLLIRIHQGQPNTPRSAEYTKVSQMCFMVNWCKHYFIS